ncbi:MAG: PAS domain S-box protein, partial [Candidatus Kapaibacteriota bacterium]
KSLKLKKIEVFEENDLADFWFDKRFQQPSYLISIPLTSGHNLLGLIAIYTYAQEYKLSKTSLYLLSALAEQISIGLERKFLADQLKIQLKLFESLVEAIPYPISYSDLITKKFRYCNISFENFVGRKREQIIGKTVEEVLPKELLDLIQEKDEEILKENRNQQFELRVKTHSNEERIYISIRSPVFIQELNEKAVVSILIDITERLNYESELKKALDYNELLLNLVPSALFTFDKDKRITFWNKQAEIITGYKSEEVVGNKCFICDEINKTNLCPIIDYSFDQNYIEKEQNFTRKDGQQIVLFKKATTLYDKDNNIIGGIEAFEDITLRKQLQQRLEYLAETNSRLTAISSFATNVDDFETLYDIILPVGQQISQSSGICFVELKNDLGRTFVSSIIHYKTSSLRDTSKTLIPIEKFVNTYVGKIFLEKAPLTVENPDESKIFEELKFLKSERFVGIPVESGEEFYGVLIAYGKDTEYIEEEKISLERLSLVFATNLDRIKYQHELQSILDKQLQINEL